MTMHEPPTPETCQLILIDHRPQMAFSVPVIDRRTGSLTPQGASPPGGRVVR